MKTIWIIILAPLIVFAPVHSATKRALLIGISQYPSNKKVVDASWGNIHGSNDVFLIEKTLKTQGFKTATLTNANATAARIRYALNKLLSEATTNDIIYVHFSCHGQPVEDINGDEADGWDEAIVPYDAWKKPIKGVYSGKNHILDDELNVFLSKLRKKVGANGIVYMVIDACHAGGIDRGDEDEFIRGTKDGFSLTNKIYTPRIDSRSHIPIASVAGWADACLLEACRSYQSNFEIKRDGAFYGPLSYYVNQVLCQNTLTTNTKWIGAVQKLMGENTRQNMVTQITQK